MAITSDGISGYRSGCRGEVWRSRTVSRLSVSASWLGPRGPQNARLEQPAKVLDELL